MEKRLEYVKKRDGRAVPFDRQKISDAIFKAAQSVGGHDRYLADDLAEVVRMYLVREYKGDVPSVEDIQDVVERILIKTGHAKTAKAYILYRQKRARARKIREGFSPDDLSEREQERAVSGREVILPVRRSDDNVSLWDKNRIVAALVRETGLGENIAELIVREVEEEIIASKAKRLSSTLIRELVNAKLIQYGFEDERRRHARLGLPFYDVKTFFENFAGLPDELSMEFGRAVKREFAVNSVLSDSAVERHLRGELVICNREGIDRCYCAVIPSVDSSAGYFSGETGRLLNAIDPFVENGIILSVPEGNIPPLPEDVEFSLSKPLNMEVSLASVNKDLMRNVSKKKVPLFFRIETAKDMEKLTADSDCFPPGGTFTVFRPVSCEGILVMNRITFNLSMMKVYAEQEEMPLNDYARSIVPLCSDLLDRQVSFVSGNRAGRELLKNFGNAERIVEAEFRDAFREKADFVTDEGFVSELLDRHISLVIRIPGDAEDREKLFRFVHTLLAQPREGRQRVAVRIAGA